MKKGEECIRSPSREVTGVSKSRTQEKHKKQNKRRKDRDLEKVVEELLELYQFLNQTFNMEQEGPHRTQRKVPEKQEKRKD
jgi:hypothetical protein